MTIALYTLIGMRFRPPEIEALVKSLPQGEPMVLRRDRDNEHDKNAVKVFARGEHVGFIRAAENKKLANWLDLLWRSRKPDEIAGKLAYDGDGRPCVEVEE